MKYNQAYLYAMCQEWARAGQMFDSVADDWAGMYNAGGPL